MRRSDKDRDLKALRNKVIGLGDESIRKSYYPELQQRLAELKDSESRFRAIFDSVSEAIFLHDVDTLQIVEVNKSMCELYGCTHDQALHMTVGDLTYGDALCSQTRAEELMRKASEGIAQSFEWHAKTLEGRPFWVDISIRRATIGGEDRLLATIHDMTQRKQVEEEKRAFYRDTILCATDGKLNICEPGDIQPVMEEAQLKLEVLHPREESSVRRCVAAFLGTSPLSEDRVSDFIIGIGEALANALKHCQSGVLYAGSNAENVWVIVSDSGPGMDSLVLPKAVLKRGFSTKTSLGLGYSIMLQVADRIMLSTDKTGTSVMLIKDFEIAEEFSLDKMPDVWEDIKELTR